ncbi:MAG: response regulator transcription factor [Gammaproteobacteria bacterium]|nr:response regulator transcription factor [Gammaproteobacteria bacterium]
MANETILIIDDEAGIRQLIRIFLQRYHYEILEAKNAEEGLEMLEKNTVNLVVLDLMLPDIYGIDLCKKIRQKSAVPIIMLTAVHGEMNMVLGFEAGADDYVEKPFSPHVLLFRIQAILKRNKGAQMDEPKIQPGLSQAAEVTIPGKVSYAKASFAQWVYYPAENCIKNLNDKMVFLTKNECLLLELFLAHEQEVLTRDRIALFLKLDIDDPESRAIDVQISRLRNKLRDKSNNNLIKSIRNKGYLLSVPVRLS